MTLFMRDREMMKQGRLEEIFNSVQEEDYSIERGAKKASMTVTEFEEKMLEAGYKLPQNIKSSGVRI